MKYFIKNMVDENCKSIIAKHLKECGLLHKCLKLGELELYEKIPKDKEYLLKDKLAKSGYKLNKNKKSMLVDEIKYHVTKIITFPNEYCHFNFSYYLSKELGYHYTYLTNVFSEEEEISIKQYVIIKKIERIKDLIVNEEANLKQIACKMQYRNVSHLCKQFKKITGVTPSCYKKRMSTKEGNL